MIENIYTTFASYLEMGSPLAYIIAFLSGVLVSFTPCVYPLIPINVGFIAGRAPGSRLKAFYLSLAFVVGTAVVYTILGIAASLLGKIFARFQTNPLSFILVGSLTLFLGLSLLGLFHLPTIKFFEFSRVKVYSGNYKYKILGAFGLGSACGLIVGPCTAPILGTLFLYVALKGSTLFAATLIFIFSLGMGTILILTGTFSYFLTNLPKSGNWNLMVKKILGWILIIYSGFLFLKAGRLLPW